MVNADDNGDNGSAAIFRYGILFSRMAVTTDVYFG